MRLLDYFRRGRSRSAAVAKDRLSIIVAREGRAHGKLDYLPQLKQELLQVLAKYEKIDIDQVTVNVEHNGDCEVLELNVILGGGTPEPLREPSSTTRSFFGESRREEVAPDAPFFPDVTPNRASATMR
jgi:cell division topological specificity factor